MRLFKSLLCIAFVCSALTAISTAFAQVPSEEIERRRVAALAQLAKGNEDEQGAAIFQLAQLSLPPAEGVPLFQAHLHRHSGTLAEALVVAHALEGLAPYGVEAKAALPDLIRLLDEVGTVEGEATNGRQIWEWLLTDLSKIGPDDPSAIEALKRTLRRCLVHPDRLDTLSAETARALGNMGRPAHSAAPLLTLALGQIPFAIPSAATALSHMMPEAGIAVPALIRALQAGQSQEAVVDALGTMGAGAKSALPVLHQTLTLSSPPLACKAFAAIAHIEGVPKLTVPESLAILRQIDKHSLSAIFAAFATVKLQGMQAEEAAPILTEIVERRTEPWLRRTSIETLAAVGPGECREAGVTLIHAAVGKDPVIALDAEKACENFGKMAEKVVPELTALLGTGGRARTTALMLLSPLGPKASPAVPALVQLLHEERNQNGNAQDAYSALRLLGRVGHEAQEAVPTLTELILEPEKSGRGVYPYTRTILLTTLMQIGVTPRVLPAVREMLQSDQATVVACAAHAVTLLGTQATDTVPLLLRPLREGYQDGFMTSEFFYGYVQDTTARHECLRALAKLGPAAKEALPLVQRFAEMQGAYRPTLRYGPPDLKTEAQQTIQAIQAVQRH